MSWFSSFFSNFKFPPPADSVQPQPRPQQPKPQLLDASSPPAAANLIEPLPSLSPTASAKSPSLPPTEDYEAIQEKGRRRNKIIFGVGLGFMGLSVLATRRSLARRRLASRAQFFQDAPANSAEQAAKVSGALEAVEALNIATINVLSVAMVATGGALWYLDLNSLADARRMIRGGLVGDTDGQGQKSEQEANEEIEEFIASVLARKDAKDEARRLTHERR